MAVLVGATGNVDPRVLAMGKAVVQRAGYAVGTVDSGYRPGSITVNKTLSLHAHNPSEAIDIGATGAKLSRLGQAALELLGHSNPPASFAGVVNGWEVAYGGDFPGWGDHTTHLHLGLKAPMPSSPSSPFPGIPSPASGAYDFQNLMLLWVGNGGRRDQAGMAAQVALLESSGHPHDRNYRPLARPPEDSRGLWQINVFAHPQYKTQDLYDPQTNVRAAIAISNNGANWGPWSTAGAARAALAIRGRVTPPTVTRPGGGGGFGIGDITGAIGGAASGAAGVVGSGADAVWGELRGIAEWGTALVKLIGFLVDPKNWLRAIEFIVGFSFVLLGVSILVVEFSKRDSATGAAARGVTKAVSAFTPAGRLARDFKRQRRYTGGRAPQRRRISNEPTPVYRVPRSSSSGPSDDVPF